MIKNQQNTPNSPVSGVHKQTTPFKVLPVMVVLVLLSLACNFSSTMRSISAPLARQTPFSIQLPTLPPSISLQLPTLPTPTPASQTTLPAPASSYQPPAEIAQLADDAAMTAHARQLFFSAQPRIDTDRATFEKDCQTQVMKNTVELGCFTSENRIFLLRLEDPRIASEMAVTAAHEMLHVAYAQLSGSDRSTLDDQLETAVSGIKDPDLLQRLKAYRALEPGQRDNELHSILGTEYPSLGIDLEQYYSLYFSDDRRAVVSAAQQFNQLFAQRETTLSNLEVQIRNMRKQMQADLSKRQINAYNQLVPQINTLVKQYNQAVRDYNALSRELMGEETPAANQ